MQRADARRNREALLRAANDAFTDVGASASLEDIARRAGVGIGTLYRHFPTRKDLFEAVYVHEVEALCQSAADLTKLAPWDALAAWLRRFVSYLATKRAVLEELASESQLLASCRMAIAEAGDTAARTGPGCRRRPRRRELRRRAPTRHRHHPHPVGTPTSSTACSCMALDGIRTPRER